MVRFDPSLVPPVVVRGHPKHGGAVDLARTSRVAHAALTQSPLHSVGVGTAAPPQLECSDLARALWYRRTRFAVRRVCRGAPRTLTRVALRCARISARFAQGGLVAGA
jgi:hypothetical protein